MPSVLIEKTGRIGTITLNRPEVMNALDMDLILELKEAVSQMGADEAIRVVVLKGRRRQFLLRRRPQPVWQPTSPPKNGCWGCVIWVQSSPVCAKFRNR